MTLRRYTWWARNDPDQLPNNYDKSYYGAKVLPSIGHQDAKVATVDLGMPGPYDNGPQRCGMLTTVATNWIGDNGFVRKVSARLKMPVIFGDCNYFKGKVAGKRIENGIGLVDLELWGENQFGSVGNGSTSAYVASPVVDAIPSAVTGVAFGMLPAMRASRLDPVEALRHE